MLNARPERKKSVQTLNRTVGLAVIMCFVTVLLLSEVYVRASSRHEHDYTGLDGSCAVCAHIQNAQKRLRQLDAAPCGMSAASFNAFSDIVALPAVSFLTSLQTLVSSKIRLNN